MSSVDRCVDAVALHIVLFEALTRMALCALEIAIRVQGRPQRMPGFQEEDGVSKFPGQAEEPFRETSRVSIESSIETHVPEAPEGGEEPRPVVEAETQLARGDIQDFFFGRVV